MGTLECSTSAAHIARSSSVAGALCVRPFQESVTPEWDRFVLCHSKGSFFHQTGWKRVMERTYGYEARYFYAERDGGIVGVAPAFLISNWLTGRSLISLPFAVYGGICAADEEAAQVLLRQLELLAQTERVEYLELRYRNGSLLPGYHANPRYATFTMPLLADPQALYEGFPKDVRYMIRKAEKAGLTARHGVDQLDSFCHLMNTTLRRLGTPSFPRGLFENLIREYPGQVDLLLVYSGARPLAGGMTFFFRDIAQPYYVGAEGEAKRVAANDFLWWQMIKFAAETGRTEFDFGRSKKDSGHCEFKKKWKPRIETLDYQVRLVQRKTVPNFSPTNPKFALAGKVWKNIPLALTRLVGPRVVRWFP